ncbi:hypothetical protein Klosneuvirus_4_19 [Klosneuvirus KNV1]|uniref:Uncharacterized protein n=1 Tax=Klosneuvirus KNV1 TaxID=1977640 RepID=A0A1V0SKR0_9VIRU|nr:hypothetical protein Klosneuvirus_4_19 [Klosneuvirus KNV1]
MNTETHTSGTHSFRGSGRGSFRGATRGSRGGHGGQHYERNEEHQSEEASYKPSYQPNYSQGSDNGSFRGASRGSDRGSFRGASRGSDRGAFRGASRGGFNESREARPYRPYKPLRAQGPVRKQQLDPHVKVEYTEPITEAHQGTIDESYPPPDPSKHKNKDKYDPEKRKLMKTQIKERKKYVNNDKERRKAFREEKKAVKNADRKEKITKIRELTQAYREKMDKEGLQPSEFVLQRMKMIDQTKEEQVKKDLEPKEEKQVVMVGNKAIRNQKFIKNARCPMTGKFVKEIWRKKFTKIGREKWDLVWQYYRDRNRESVLSKFKKLEELEIEVTYFNEPNPTRFIVPKIDIEEEQPDTRASKKTKLVKLVKILENLEVKLAGAGGYISPPDKVKLEGRIEFMKQKIQKFEQQIEKLNKMYGAQTEYDQEVIKGLLGGAILVDPKNITYVHPKTKEPLTKEQFEQLYKVGEVSSDFKKDTETSNNEVVPDEQEDESNEDPEIDDDESISEDE